MKGTMWPDLPPNLSFMSEISPHVQCEILTLCFLTRSVVPSGVNALEGMGRLMHLQKTIPVPLYFYFTFFKFPIFHICLIMHIT